ncbi:uncharacterized protein N7459_007618 [Penicillium hispanicum]|uniref:uncharacterized protein n=1 Tax=Penicillium hispanicum TaxID=1080232 RepID=UPI0025410E5A|nr:uncharacterized protein N7459_007618 [Penicillium hispanicum]KAJ5578654.1 hypothetical protein N7459_007618 [Penicillium hispanicum]
MSPLFLHADKHISVDQDYDDGIEWAELETNGNPQLRKMMIYLRYEQDLFSAKELAKLGVAVITLPAAESLLSDEGPFRPHPPFDPDQTVMARHKFPDVESADKMGGSYSTIPSNLSGGSSEMFQDILLSKGVYELDTICPWGGMITMCPFFGILDGLYEQDYREYHWLLVNLSEWRQLVPFEPRRPESGTISVIPPHVRIFMGTACRGPENGLLRSEMRAIVTAIYNRVRQPGYEDESTFPLTIVMQKVLLIAGYDHCQARIIEAVFDKLSNNLTLRCTPIYDFLKKEECPWELFMRLAISSPQDLESRLAALSI